MSAEPMRTRSNAPRPPAEHDPWCTRPGWRIQDRILSDTALMAYCAGCTAVTIRRPRHRPPDARPRREQ